MIISIDFDGVLHSDDMRNSVANIDVATAAQLHAAGLFAHVESLVGILAPHPNVELIVHSGWRMTSSLARLRDVLGPLASRVIGVTDPALDRELSIIEWLRQHSFEEGAVLVLDDQPEVFDRLRPNLVVCDRTLGLSDPTTQECLRTRLKAGLPQSGPDPQSPGLAADDRLVLVDSEWSAAHEPPYGSIQ